MKSFAEFRSSKFPAYDGEENDINPGLWGRRMADYLIEQLSERGVETHGVSAEDWGYYIPIQSESGRLALCCGHQYGDDDVFVVFLDQPTSRIKRLLGLEDSAAKAAASAALIDAQRDILESDADIGLLARAVIETRALHRATSRPHPAPSTRSISQ